MKKYKVYFNNDKNKFIKYEKKLAFYLNFMYYEVTVINTSKGSECMEQKKLASIRRSKNISQRELAKVIGVATETYNNKELGKTQFKASEMFAIANCFNMTIDEIFLPPNFMNHEVKQKESV